MLKRLTHMTSSTNWSCDVDLSNTKSTQTVRANAASVVASEITL